MVHRVVPILFLLVVASAFAQLPKDAKVKHVVALMFENRAFDHMLGHLKAINPEINGLTGHEFNRYDPKDPTSPVVKVSFNAPDNINFSPGHSIQATSFQLFGQATPIHPAPMNGFVYDTARGSKSVLSSLAINNTLFDGWFSSVPGPTGPNRLYALSGTSAGEGANILAKELVGFSQRTFMDDLESSKNVHPIDQFFKDAAAGTLPTFSYVEPRWFAFGDWKESDQHPRTDDFIFSGDILPGEFLLKRVYEALRRSPAWKDTLLFIYYDEHGGLYDHVPPPSGVPNPDGINSNDPPFDFTRLGVRIPAVAISPWLPKSTITWVCNPITAVVHAPTSGAQFDHTSLLGTLRKLFKLKSPPLTKREAWARTFEGLFTQLKEARDDHPMELTLPPGQEEAWREYMRAETGTMPEVATLKRMALNVPRTPISDLQMEILDVAKALVQNSEDFDHITHEQDGFLYAREQLAKWLHQNKP